MSSSRVTVTPPARATGTRGAMSATVGSLPIAATSRARPGSGPWTSVTSAVPPPGSYPTSIDASAIFGAPCASLASSSRTSRVSAGSSKTQRRKTPRGVRISTIASDTVRPATGTPSRTFTTR